MPLDPIAILKQAFTLPCGITVPNRIVKSAMSENNADQGAGPSKSILQLYERWGQGGAGILVTGNVMIDRRALGEPHNVVVEDERHLTELAEWAERAQYNGSQLWMQINHPGRQAPNINKEVVSPSDVQLPMMKKVFKKPRPLKEEEILDLIDRYGNTAAIAKKAGFSGVQIHGAHGYLVSQFLSTRTNLRTDRWGGSLENRARFVIEVYRDMRKKVGPAFPVGIKINSADFQRGAFTEEESLQVIDLLSAEGIDMIEVSGGTYERSAMMGLVKKESTRKREAYFADFIVKARARTSVPLMLTGGFRTRDVMAEAIQNNELDFVGMARPFAVNPDIAIDFFEDRVQSIEAGNIKTGIKFIDRTGILDINWYAEQMRRMGRGKEAKPNLSPWWILLKSLRS